MSNGDSKYRSRKWILACFVEGVATVVLFFLIYKLIKEPVYVIPLLTWWAGVSAGVLTLYQAGLIADKKLNGRGK